MDSQVSGGSSPWDRRNEAGRTFRIGRSEQRREPGPLLRRPDHGLLRADLVQDRAQVVHPGLEGRDFPDPVGQPRPALVEQHHASERCQALDEANEERLFPDGEEIAGEAAREHDVDGAPLHDLVCDRDVALLAYRTSGGCTPEVS
jgi:hypothetical protein